MRYYPLIKSGAVLVGVASLALGGTAYAAPKATAAVSYVRSAHLSPTTPGVDVYLTSFSGHTSRLWVAAEKYGAVSPYVATAPGIYTVSMRPHGESASRPAMLSWTLQVAAGQAYTAAAVGSGSARKGTVFHDDLSTPSAGKARVRLIQAASHAAKATVVAVRGPVLAKNAAFATATGYAQISAGTWPLQAASATTPPVRVTGSVSVPSGSVTSIVLLDNTKGGLRFETIQDAAAAVKMPKGPVHAGGGATASTIVDRPSQNRTGVAATLTLVAVMTAAAFGYRLRRRLRAVTAPTR